CIRATLSYAFSLCARWSSHRHRGALENREQETCPAVSGPTTWPTRRNEVSSLDRRRPCAGGITTTARGRAALFARRLARADVLVVVVALDPVRVVEAAIAVRVADAAGERLLDAGRARGEGADVVAVGRAEPRTRGRRRGRGILPLALELARV